jgi:hypothetical protein
MAKHHPRNRIGGTTAVELWWLFAYEDGDAITLNIYRRNVGDRSGQAATGVVQDQHQRRYCGKGEGEKRRKLAIRGATVNDECSLKFDDQSLPQSLEHF